MGFWGFGVLGFCVCWLFGVSQRPSCESSMVWSPTPLEMGKRRQALAPFESSQVYFVVSWLSDNLDVYMPACHFQAVLVLLLLALVACILSQHTRPQESLEEGHSSDLLHCSSFWNSVHLWHISPSWAWTATSAEYYRQTSYSSCLVDPISDHSIPLLADLWYWVCYLSSLDFPVPFSCDFLLQYL